MGGVEIAIRHAAKLESIETGKISFDWDEIPLVHKYEFAKINKTLKNSAITVRFMRFFEFYLFELCGITCRCKLASGRLQEGIIFHDGSQGGFL